MSEYKCPSKTNKGNHHFVLPTNVLLNGKREYSGTCKLCGHSRMHKFPEDIMAKGRQALKIKRDLVRTKGGKK